MSTDIDIDVSDRAKVLELFRHVPASNKSKKHNTGVYLHKIPKDPFSGLCSIDYKEAEKLGYFKIDILNVSIYKDVKDENHLITLLETEPNWELLEDKEFCDRVFHMRGHHDICKIMKPRNELEIAAVLAMIRPAKKHLVGKPWEEVLKSVWFPPKDGQYHFKKAHGLAYSFAVKLHMNLLVESDARLS